MEVGGQCFTGCKVIVGIIPGQDTFKNNNASLKIHYHRIRTENTSNQRSMKNTRVLPYITLEYLDI